MIAEISFKLEIPNIEHNEGDFEEWLKFRLGDTIRMSRDNPLFDIGIFAKSGSVTYDVDDRDCE